MAAAEAGMNEEMLHEGLRTSRVPKREVPKRRI